MFLVGPRHKKANLGLVLFVPPFPQHLSIGSYPLNKMLLARVYTNLVQQNPPVPNFCWSNQPTAVRALPLSWPWVNPRGTYCETMGHGEVCSVGVDCCRLEGHTRESPLCRPGSCALSLESWPHPCGSSRPVNACLLGESHILYLPGQHTPSASS